MSKSFRTSHLVEFRETDAAGIAHFSNFFAWMEAAEHELLRSVGLSVVTTDATGTITWPRVAARCDYQGPVRFEETVDIEVRVPRTGLKSVTYDFQFSGPRGAVATGEITAVCCRIAADGSFRSILIPDDMRRGIETYASQ
ncbi:MAG TPA: thioesterase family protein [Pirellulales bacterium]|nr:thioesterase family protein [Pirellulales bacterium]